ncbi:heterokaryon incompatibility protein-domain-containing protein [Xylaria cubensis]|nr:heterokaryon incompatibility protein-domain-containing protein [Xylaria cubensis]
MNRIRALLKPASKQQRADECDKCRDIRAILCIASKLTHDPEYFRLAFPQSRNTTGFCLANVGLRFLEPSDTSCQLCLMLMKSRINSKQDYFEEDCKLIALPFSVACGRVRDRSVIEDNSVALFIGQRKRFKPEILAARNGVAVLSKLQGDPNLFSLRLVPEYYDYEMIRPWIRYCQEHHKLCRPDSSIVNDLHLIDCESRRVKPAAENDRYVALSYVWGRCAAQQSDDFTKLPVSLPRVISDAISVTMALGYRYLWVDKYCIDQNNDFIKHDQIRQMHIIYEKAELTIVAACGLDQNDGLTGVSTPRSGMMINLGNASLSWVTDPQQSIRDSRWSTRGWTFQEGAFARRRLVFTKEQVYFECSEMNCRENLQTPLDSPHIKDETKINNVYRAGMFGRGQWFGRMNTQSLSGYHEHLQYCACVKEYSSRTLTYDTDVLNAFLGIIQRFELRKYTQVIHGILRFPGQLPSNFCHFLCWHHHKSVKVKRRPQFPSWTWLGWSGGVRFPVTRVDHWGDLVFGCAFQDLMFESRAGHKWETPPTEDRSQPSQWTYLMLCLKVHEVPGSLIIYEEIEVSWYLCGHIAELYLSKKTISAPQLSEELKDGSTWRCIYLGANGPEEDGRPGAECWIMLLKRMSRDTWSRAGLFKVHCHGLAFRYDSGIFDKCRTEYKIC